LAKYQIVAMVQIETDDPLLDPDRINVATARATADLRRAVMRAMPRDTTRIIAVLPVETAMLMCAAHEAASAAAGLPAPHRPPNDYIPPTPE